MRSSRAHRSGASESAGFAHKGIKVSKYSKEVFVAPIVNMKKTKFLPLKAFEKAFELEHTVEKVEKSRLRAGFRRMREVC